MALWVSDLRPVQLYVFLKKSTNSCGPEMVKPYHTKIKDYLLKSSKHRDTKKSAKKRDCEMLVLGEAKETVVS